MASGMAVSSSSNDVVSSCSSPGSAFLCVVGLCSQPGLSPGSSLSPAWQLSGKEHLCPCSSNKCPRIHSAWANLDPCTCPSCTDLLNCSLLFCLSHTYVPFKSYLSSIASIYSLLFLPLLSFAFLPLSEHQSSLFLLCN